MYCTTGNRICQDGRDLTLKAVNWFGFEQPWAVLGGLDQRPLGELLALVRGFGFNALRLPFSNWMLEQGRTTGQERISPKLNPELVGLTPLERLDFVMDRCAKTGLGVILDRHCYAPSKANGDTWVSWDQGLGKEKWIADWVKLATRYRGNPALIGCDLHNEPHTDAIEPRAWSQAAGECGRAILAANPDPLIIVEGVEFCGDWWWWGGNLRWIEEFPVNLGGASKLVYSPHDYGPEVYAQPWFADSRFPANLPGAWERHWGFIHTQGIAPLLVGEFGGRDLGGSGPEGQWFRELAKLMVQRRLSFAYWCLNPDSHDTGGLLKDDWRTLETEKISALRGLLEN